MRSEDGELARKATYPEVEHDDARRGRHPSGPRFLVHKPAITTASTPLTCSCSAIAGEPKAKNGRQGGLDEVVVDHGDQARDRPSEEETDQEAARRLSDEVDHSPPEREPSAQRSGERKVEKDDRSPAEEVSLRAAPPADVAPEPSEHTTATGPWRRSGLNTSARLTGSPAPHATIPPTMAILKSTPGRRRVTIECEIPPHRFEIMMEGGFEYQGRERGKDQAGAASTRVESEERAVPTSTSATV
jgi:hypothetical protein